MFGLLLVEFFLQNVPDAEADADAHSSMFSFEKM